MDFDVSKVPPEHRDLVSEAFQDLDDKELSDEALESVSGGAWPNAGMEADIKAAWESAGGDIGDYVHTLRRMSDAYQGDRRLLIRTGMRYSLQMQTGRDLGFN